MPLPDFNQGHKETLSVVPLCRGSGTPSLMRTGGGCPHQGWGAERDLQGGWASSRWAQRPRGCGAEDQDRALGVGLFMARLFLRGSFFVFLQISATSFWKIPGWLSCAEDGKRQKLESEQVPAVRAPCVHGRGQWKANKGEGAPGLVGGTHRAPPQPLPGAL